MKNIFILIITINTLTLFSCTKNSDSSTTDNSTYSLDPDIFIKVTFNGKTLTNYGLFKDGIAIKEQRVSALIGSQTQGTTLSSVLQLSSTPITINNISTGTLYARSTLYKSSNILGNYTTTGGSEFSDVTFNKIYGIDYPSYIVTVTSFDTKYVKGTFVCNLLDGATILPAIGTFSLYRQ